MGNLNVRQRRGALALALAIVLGVVAFIWGGTEAQGTDASQRGSTSADAEGKCSGTWEITQSDNGNNRWFARGIEQIRQAETEPEAREAAKTWLDQVKRDPELLVGAAAYFLDREVDPAALAAGDCASGEAKQLVAEIELALAESEVTPEDAPSDGYNSGVNADGEVVVAEHAGITGDRSAVKVVMKDGTTLWLMARCGNPVVKVPPKVPKGPTDQPPPPTTTTTQPPLPPTTAPRHTDIGEPCAAGDPSCQPPGPDPGPTEGYEAGNAEEVSESQEEAENDGVDEPSPHGEPAPDESGTPGETEGPDGTETGGNEGVSDPEDTEGSGTNNDEEVDNPF